MTEPGRPLYTLAEAARAVGGTFSGAHGERGFSSCSIDSRTMAPGELFVAVKGENLDGHDYVRAALDAGAAAAMVSRVPEAASERPLLVVPDVIEAFQALALHARRKWPMTVVGITGSMGKTTTKELTALALSAGYRVMASEGNLNSQVGLPLCMLRRRPDHDAGVFEMGMSRPGEIARLARAAEPTVGVLTNVSSVHLEFFGSIEKIAEAKKELLDALPEDGLAILNADDARVLAMAGEFKGRAITYGLTYEKADVRGVDAEHHRGGMRCRVRVPYSRTEALLRIDLPGAHNLSNALAAMACAWGMGVDLAASAEAIAAFRALSGRGDVIELGRGVTLIDDSYNSNPAALLQSARAARAMAGQRRRLVIVTGDMLELGPTAGEMHRESGEELTALGAGVLVAIGPLSRATAEGARAAGLAGVSHYEDSNAAAPDVASMVEPGDVVLVKGSRGMRTDIVARALKDAWRAE